MPSTKDRKAAAAAAPMASRTPLGGVGYAGALAAGPVTNRGRSVFRSTTGTAV